MRYGLALDLLGALNDFTGDSDHPRQDGHPTSNIQRDGTRRISIVAILDANGREKLQVKWPECPFDAKGF